MRYFVHVKDDVIYAWHESSNEVDIDGDNVHQVEFADDSILNKKYENGTISNADKIKYAVLDSENDNTVIGIKETYFSSEVEGPIINDSSVKVLWKWNGESFVSPNTVSSAVDTVTAIDMVEVDGLSITTSPSIPATSNVIEEVVPVTE
jgi:hypothetical protein